MAKKRLIVIDGNALVHRAFHALPLLRTKKGELVNAVYGFFLIFLKAIKDLKPDFVIATFDLPGPTFRHKKFAQYKITRPKAPSELYQQIPKVKEVLKQFKVPVLEKQGFEADDLIGTIARKAPQKQVLPEIETIILSGDLDTLQLIDKNTKVYTMKRGLKDTVLYDEKAVRERFGLAPEQLIDFKALKGDPSDNIPGVPGIGEKTASKLLKRFRTLENIYQEIAKGTEKIKPRWQRILQEHKDIAQFSKVLAQIKTNIPLDLDLKKARWPGYDPDQVTKAFQDLGFYTLVERLPAGQKPEKKEILGQIEELYQEGLFSKKIYEIEKALIPVVKNMEANGIKVDADALQNLSSEFEKRTAFLEKKIFELAGTKFNLNSPQQLSEVLFEKLKLPKAKIKQTGQGLVSTAWPELVKLREEHPIIDLIGKYREFFKLKSGFLDPLPQFIQKDGRLHPHLHQLGTATGRFSCSEFNLQNVPTKGKLGRAIRKCFVAPKDFLLVSADYSQIELRLAAHFSGDKKLLGFFRQGKDVHEMTAAEIFNLAEERVTASMRKLAKTLNFGLLYGLGIRSFAQSAGISLKEAKQFRDGYFKKFKGMARFLEEAVQEARQKEFSQTLWGRKRPLAEINSRDPRLRARAERMAKNLPLQGTAADIIKKAMVKINEQLTMNNEQCRMLLQIHDELLFEISKERVKELAPKIKQIMENIVELKVALKVELRAGNNWGELEVLNP